MSGGILGMFSPQGQGSGILGNIHNAVVENGDGIMGLGLGLMSGNMENASQGYMQGQRLDTARRQQKLLQDQELQKRTAAQAIAQKMGLDPQLAQGDPDTVLGLYKQVQAHKLTQSPEKPDFSVIGEDEFGNKKYGWINKSTQTVSPFAQPGQAAATAQSPDDQAIPPAPPGVNPKIWRDEQTKALAGQGQPTLQQTNDLAKAERAGADLKQSLARYAEIVAGPVDPKTGKRIGGTGAEAWNGPDKARLGVAYQDALLKMKEAANLGVLNGPDLELMQKQLEDAQVTGIDRVNPFAAVRSFGIEDRVNTGVDELTKSVDRGLVNARTALGGKGKAAQAVKGKTQTGIGWSAN